MSPSRHNTALQVCTQGAAEHKLRRTKLSGSQQTSDQWPCCTVHLCLRWHEGRSLSQPNICQGDRPVLACRSVSKESQNRYSRAAKDWGWREFLTLTTLFDADSGFLVNDAVEFAAEVLVLRESSETRHVSTALLLAPPAEHMQNSMHLPLAASALTSRVLPYVAAVLKAGKCCMLSSLILHLKERRQTHT